MKKKFIFLVQGEGRGHMTQALVLYNILIKNGHEVTAVLIGTSGRRQIPDYFRSHIDADIIPLPSPNFVLDRSNKSLLLLPSILFNIRYLRTYFKSLKKIHRQIREKKPDILINFYDFLGGFYFLFFKSETKHIVIGHQFLTGHPLFPFAPHRPLEKWLFLLNNRLTSLRSVRKIGLSFTHYKPETVGDLVVTPPLIREDITRLRVRDEGFILAYIVNDGYAEEIMEWHEKHRSVIVHCFWDRKEVPDEYQVHENLTFHQIDHAKFVDMMSRCSGYASTAGFESICEAMYLGKPILMVPVESQYEQACNAIDAVNSGAGVQARHFDLSELPDM